MSKLTKGLDHSSEGMAVLVVDAFCFLILVCVRIYAVMIQGIAISGDQKGAI